MRRVLGSTSLRTAVIAAVMAALVAFPIGVFASHQFTDVPTSYTFHGDIDHVYDARITNGCTATTYCPEDDVTRGQMAAFLARSGGRVGYGTEIFVPISDGNPTVIGTVSLKVGNVTGGQAFVKLDAAGYIYTSVVDATGCNAACQVQFYIVRTGASQVGNYGLTIVSNTSATEIEGGSFAITTAIQVPTGVSQTFTLYAQRTAGTGTLTGIGDITAMYVPFGATGGNTLASDGVTIVPPDGAIDKK